MLKTLGRRYVIDHVISVAKQLDRQEACRYYIADALRCIVNNTAEQGERFLLNVRLRDVLNPVEQASEDDDKKAKDIIENIRKKLGGEAIQ